MDNLRGLLGIRKMDRVTNAWIRHFCRMVKGMDERIDESVLRWFDRFERMENDRITKRVYAGSHSLGQPRKRWNDYLKKQKQKEV